MHGPPDTYHAMHAGRYMRADAMKALYLRALGLYRSSHALLMYIYKPHYNYPFGRGHQCHGSTGDEGSKAKQAFCRSPYFVCRWQLECQR